MTWNVSSSTDPHGIDDIFAENKHIVLGERIGRAEIELRLDDRDELLTVIRLMQAEAFQWDIDRALAALPERLR